MKKILLLFNKYKEIILYLFFGVLTTLINIITYYFFTRYFHVSEYVSNVIAWVLSVLFAFITNKLFVFESKKINWKVILRETISFFSFRLLSLGIDMGCMFIMISLCKWNDMISKIVVNIIVIVLNYIFSKVFVFHDLKQERCE